jgi:hypothetical protein
MENYITFENIRTFLADAFAIMLGIVATIWGQLHKNENRRQNNRIKNIESKIEVLSNIIHEKEEAIAILQNENLHLQRQVSDLKKSIDT